MIGWTNQIEMGPIYSIAYIKQRSVPGEYIALCNEHQIILKTERQLSANKWVRFVGIKESADIVECKFIENLDGVNISLVRKWIEKLKRRSA